MTDFPQICANVCKILYLLLPLEVQHYRRIIFRSYLADGDDVDGRVGFEPVVQIVEGRPMPTFARNWFTVGNSLELHSFDHSFLFPQICANLTDLLYSPTRRPSIVQISHFPDLSFVVF